MGDRDIGSDEPDPQEVLRARKERENRQSPLLKLPGEIRDLIYDFVVAEEGPIKIKHVDPQLQRFTEVESQYEFRTSDPLHISMHLEVGTSRFSHFELEQENADEIGTFAGLARVCRQIRSEYLPVHKRRVPVAVRFVEADYFVQTLFDEHCPIWSLCFYCGCDYHGNSVHNETVELLPLLRAKMRFPEFSIDIDKGQCRRNTPFHILMKLLAWKNEQWRNLLCTEPCSLESIKGYIGDESYERPFEQTIEISLARDSAFPMTDTDNSLDFFRELMLDWDWTWCRILVRNDYRGMYMRIL